MNQVIIFKPRHELTAQENLNDFINLARDKLTLWSDLKEFSWNADRWPTAHGAARFTNFENSRLHHSRPIEAHQMIHPAFAACAKAYLRYKHTLRPHKYIAQEMRALRAMEFALRQDMAVPDITKFKQIHWDMAVSALEPAAARQGVCDTMLDILKMLADLRILTVEPRYWRHPYVGQRSYEAINGVSASNEAKAKKLPNQDALLAIAEVFSRGTNETQNCVDIMITCITGFLMSAPSRIGETLRFRTNCLREDFDKNGELQYYLAYWVPKTQQFTRKAIPRTMVEVTKESVKRLRAITDEGRRLARYMETSPVKFYRHPNCPDVDDDQILTPAQVVEALGFASRSSVGYFIRRHTGSCSLKGLTLGTLWQMVLREHCVLNPHFPYQEAPDCSAHPPLKMSESLLCFLRFQLASNNNTCPVLLSSFCVEQYSARLSSTNKKNEPSNFFSQHGYETYKLNSHSLRHYLNRLGRNRGIPVDVLTEWSSRATTRQTRTYLNDDPLTAASKGAVVLGTTQEQAPQKPVTNEEADLYGQGPFHRSRYGICRRSWRAGPCNKFADCLNCSELLMCKGDKIAAEIIKMDRENLVCTYTAAQHAIAQGERAASRWTEKAEPQIERLDQLLAILHNPEIPDGSPIEMAGVDFSHEKVIVSAKAEAAGVKLLDRNELRITYGDDLLACLELLRSSDNA